MPDHEFIAPRAGRTAHEDRSAVPHAGSYRRVLPVSLERLYENALDWEHLPHLHASSFAEVRCLDAGTWGWRAAVTARKGRDAVIELVLERACRRWITRTLDGFGAGTEIWTHACPVSQERVDIVVDFFIPGLDAARRAEVGEAYARAYARLYDEDVAMMTERQRQLQRRLDRARDHERTLVLGPRGKLDLPMEIVLGGRAFVLAEVEGALAAFPRQCPHQLGPLGAEALVGRVVTCPWHGDRFDVRSGENLSGRNCRFSHLPELDVDADGNVRAIATH
jgi:nitrite reductase/ring-hydroxylating ferredoxin subunit